MRQSLRYVVKCKRDVFNELVKEHQDRLRTLQNPSVSSSLAFAHLLRAALEAYAAERGLAPDQCVPPEPRGVANEQVGRADARKKMRIPIRNYRLRGGAH